MKQLTSIRSPPAEPKCGVCDIITASCKKNSKSQPGTSEGKVNSGEGQRSNLLILKS